MNSVSVMIFTEKVLHSSFNVIPSICLKITTGEEDHNKFIRVYLYFKLAGLGSRSSVAETAETWARRPYEVL